MHVSKDMYKNIHSNTIHNRKNLKTMQMPDYNRMSKYTMVYWDGIKQYGLVSHIQYWLKEATRQKYILYTIYVMFKTHQN